MKLEIIIRGEDGELLEQFYVTECTTDQNGLSTAIRMNIESEFETRDHEPGEQRG